MNKKQFLCYLLAVMLLLTDVTVSAAMFSDSPVNTSGNIFSAGENIFSGDTEGTPAVNQVPTVTPVPTAAPIPTVTPVPTAIPEEGGAISSGGGNLPGTTIILEVTPTVTPPLTVTPVPIVTPDAEVFPGLTPTVEPTPTPEETPTPEPTPTILPEERVITLSFCDVQGNVYEDLTVSIKLEEEIILPNVPGRELAVDSGWKLEQELPDEEAVLFPAQETFLLSQTDAYVMEHLAEDELKFYAVNGIDPCTVTFYNNGGTGIFRKTTVKHGTVLTLPDFPKSGYRNHGWAVSKGNRTVTYHFGETLEVTQDIKLYIVRYALLDVIFKGPTGKYGSSYKKLSTIVEKYSTIQLPQVPVVKGYQNLGWAPAPNASKASWKEGQTVKITKAQTYYAVRKKVGTYKVNFYNHKGNANAAFRAISGTVTRNDTIKLPPVPKASGYTALGWSAYQNQTTAKFKEGEAVKVTKNMSFYAVYKKNVNVVLHKNNGTVWKTVSIVKDGYYKLPGASSKLPYTMMGWSLKAGKTANPDYEVGEQIQATKTIHLYAVVFKRNKEKNYSARELSEPALRDRYRQVIFVGDSRTNRLQETLRVSGLSFSSEGLSFVVKEGQGLVWFQNEGYAQLLEKIGKGKRGKPTAVIFNLGVNDLENISSYVSYFKKISTELKERNCKLYIMSVNPLNNTLVTARGKKSRPEESIRSFNLVMKRNLCSAAVGYTYIDSYSYLMYYGYGTDANGYGYDSGVDDGLHYTVKTSKRIYRYCIKSILQ